MLTFYHTPLSPNSRRVWITLLEKHLPFTEVVMTLQGDQLTPEFLALNPFHHIPVLVDDGFRVLESLAILDYLEAKYPEPALLPRDPQSLAVVRMAQMVALNELSPASGPLVGQWLGMSELDEAKATQARDKVAHVLGFLEKLLADAPYFGGDSLSVADIVCGISMGWFPALGIPMSYSLNAWLTRLQQRLSWQHTQPTAEAIEGFKARMQARRSHPS
ncbi:MAG: glutathione S-transferase family protein [Synechococcales cyanobacterium]